MSARPVLDRLGAVVGAQHLMCDAFDIAPFRADGRGGEGGAPLAVIRPSSQAQIVEVVRIAADHGVRIVAQGGRTGLVGAGLVQTDVPTLVLSLDRLNGHIEIDAANRTATVDAGVTLSALNARAAEHGLFFPIDLGADPSIGGMIAANTGGARLLRYGDVRANLLAVDMVRADRDGTTLSLGAPLRKNNTGIDLKQFMVGSSGSMGIVTRATVALHPVPLTTTTALVALSDPHRAIDVLLALEAGFGSLLSAFEGISRAAFDAALSHRASLRRPFAEARPPYAVLIELAAGAAFDAEWLEERLAETLEPFMVGDDPVAIDVAIDRRDGLWAIRHTIPEALRTSGTVVACDISLRRGDVMRFRDEVSARLAAEVPGLILHDFGHIGDGGMHFNMVWPKASGPLDPALANAARDIVFGAAVDEYGGSFSAEHGVGPRNAAHYQRFVAEDQRRLAGQLQQLIAPVPIGRVDFGMIKAEEPNHGE